MATKASSKVVDFTNVKEASGFNKSRVPEGDYIAKVTKVEDAVSKKDNEFQYLFTIKLQKYSQYAYPYYCKLQENQLWKLRNLLVAAGLTVPKKRMKLDPSKVIGKPIGVTMSDTEYEGKMQSEINAIFPANELDSSDIADDDVNDTDEEMEDEEYEEEGDGTEEDEGDEFDSMDRAELKSYIKGRDPEFSIKKSMTDDDLRDSARDLRGDDTEAEDEEDEEEPEPEPEPKKAKKGKKAKKAAAIDDDDLEDLDIEDL